ncbi:MAG: TraR/DksA family transcriptional regulator [Actinomycetota bacterium]
MQPNPAKNESPITQEMVESARVKIGEEISIVEAELADLGFGQDGSVAVSFDEGFADAAHTTAERVKALSLAEGLQQRLAEARGALLRIDQGTYGKCENCGLPIGLERLEAVPSTRLCISCKQAGV